MAQAEKLFDSFFFILKNCFSACSMHASILELFTEPHSRTISVDRFPLAGMRVTHSASTRTRSYVPKQLTNFFFISSSTGIETESTRIIKFFFSSQHIVVAVVVVFVTFLPSMPS